MNREPMTDRSMISDNARADRWMLLMLLAIAVLMTLKYFPGLEHTDAYAGNTLSAIDPGAFKHDPFIDPDRPFWKRVFQISLIYLPAHLMGDIWLDDRFIAVVYLLLVFATLVAVDKIVQLAGITGIVPRLLIQILFMRDHHYLTLTATFANQPDINHAAYVIPATAWLLYVTFARKSLWLILLFCFLTVASSIKMAPYVIAFSLVIAFINGSRRDRIIVAVLLAAGLAGFVYAATSVFYIPPDDRLFIWDWMYNDVEKWDSNPIYPFPSTNVWMRNIVFLVIMGAAMTVPARDATALRNLKVFVFLGVVLWAFAILFFTFVPDDLKYPHIMPFSMVRNLRWPQTIAYIILFVWALRWLEDHHTRRDLALSSLVLGALFVTGPNNHELWIALSVCAGAVSAVAYGGYLYRSGAPGGVAAIWTEPRHAQRFLLAAFGLAILVAFGTTIQKRLPDWAWMMRHGIYGGSEVAKWINMIDVVKEQTPKDAIILPLEYYPAGTHDRLRARRHLGSRTGRAIPVLRECSSIFDAEGLKFELAQQENMEAFEDAMHAKDWALAYDRFLKIEPSPGYLILPDDVADAAFFEVFPFRKVTGIDSFTLYVRTRGSGRPVS